MFSVDDRFEFPVPPALRVLFASDSVRLKGENSSSESLLKRINDNGQVFMHSSCAISTSFFVFFLLFVPAIYTQLQQYIQFKHLVKRSVVMPVQCRKRI
uniref:Uncharacterized protein n=1 Tax=Daphnia galeata TaxID=27404 RepID=A0A8J2WM83_9CRUS|nr:unnamed protein product [Daphnia galeata]